MAVAFSPDGRRVASGATIWLLHPSACDKPEWLQLSIEIRSGLAWDVETKRPYPLSEEELKIRNNKTDGKFCGARVWEDLSPEELAALRGPVRK